MNLTLQNQEMFICWKLSKEKNGRQYVVLVDQLMTHGNAIRDKLLINSEKIKIKR